MRYMMKLCALLLIVTAAVSANSILGVNYPLGIKTPISGYASRMGGAAIGATEPYVMMSLNPGNLANATTTVYSFKAQLEYLRLKADNGTAEFFGFDPQFLSFAIPMKKVGTIGFSYTKEAGNEYSYLGNKEILAINPHGDTTGYLSGQLGFRTTTGLTSWQLGYAREVFSFLKPGIAIKRYNLSKVIATSTILDKISSLDNLSSTLDTTVFSQSVNSFAFGVNGTLGKVSYGISGEYPFKGDLEVDSIIHRMFKLDEDDQFPEQGMLLHDSSITSETYKLRLAPTGGAGVSVELNKNFTINSDFAMTFWERMSTTSTTFSKGTLQNTVRISAGTQFTPVTNKLNPKYFEIINYSAGIRYESLPLKGDWEGSLTIGAGLPLGRTGMIDLAVEGGYRTSDTYNYKENFLRFSIGTNGGRFWNKK